MAPQHILIEHPRPDIRLIRLHRPKALNALCAELTREVAAALDEAAADPVVRVALLAGSERAFAAGADISEFQTGAIAMFQSGMFQAWDRVAAFPKPLIAAVRGFALGGGAEFAWMCDMIVAGESATFGQPEINLGLMPGAGGTQRITRVAGKAVAMELMLTGRRFGAKEALAWGLVNQVVPDAEVEAKALELAEKIAAMSPQAVRLIKQAVLEAYEAPLSSALRHEKDDFYLLFAGRDKAEGVAAFLEKRKPVFTGE